MDASPSSLPFKFVRLEVSAFKAIERADVRFGPALTVLHGPNDLGKSTLVEALRAALMLPVTSAGAETFVSWYAAQPPRVVLTLEVGTDSFWRITKQFVDGASAELHTSKDQVTWTLAAKARAVDEQVRSRLGWGLGAFGGPKRQQKMPDAFIATALLGAQDGVNAVLAASLENDVSPTGRETLTRALSVLAQDPLFKSVLDLAQGEVSRYFSEGGRQKRGRDSPFVNASNEVKALESQLGEVKAALDEAMAVEARVAALEKLHDEAVQRVDAARRELEALGTAMALSTRRAELEAAVHRARSELDAIDELQARAERLRQDAETARRAVDAAAPERSRTREALEAARRAEAQAQARLEAARRGDAERLLELEASKLAARQAQLEAERTRLSARHADAARTVEAEKARHLKVQALEAAQRDVASGQASLQRAKERLAAATQQAELAGWLLDYGRWRQAERDVARAEETSKRAAALLEEAGRRRAAMEQASQVLAAEAAELDAQALPGDELLTRLKDLDRSRREADARVEGGLSVVVRTREPLQLHVEADDEPPVDEARVSGERVIEAERRVLLSIGTLVDIEVGAGRKELRAMADALSKRWKKEALPVLAAAGVSSVEELEKTVARQQQARAALERRRAALETERKDADALEREAALLKHAAAGPSREELARRRARIPDAQLLLLEQAFPGLGDDWEGQATALEQEARRQEASAREAVAQLEAALAAARAKEVAAREALSALPPPVDGAAEALASASRELEACQQELAGTQAALGALERQKGSEVAAAEAALAAAVQALGAAEQAEARAEQTHASLLAQEVEARTRAAAQTELARAQDRTAAEEALHRAEAAFAPVRAVAVVTAEQLAAAEAKVAACTREREQAFAQLSAERGVLGRLAGPSVRERRAQLEEALVAARQREAQVQLEADSWKLLRDTLREVENVHTAHLGEALAGPLSARFSALTAGRYGRLGLDAHLSTKAVAVTGAATDETEVVRALSVGTRDQLATLLRLVLAQQLRMPLVLDDHLVHTDVARLDWFRREMLQTAQETQVLVLTCRPRDYGVGGSGTSPGGQVSVVDLTTAITPWAQRPGGPGASSVTGDDRAPSR